MSQLSSTVLEAFKEFDSPTIFNAVVLKLGLPNEDYTDHQIRCLLPELAPVIGYAVTVEVTSNDADSVAVPWEEPVGTNTTTGSSSSDRCRPCLFTASQAPPRGIHPWVATPRTAAMVMVTVSPTSSVTSAT